MYVTDNDSRLPDARSWEPLLRPYYRNPSMVICPQDIRLPWYRRNAGLTTDTPLDFVSYDMVPHWSLRKLPLGKQAAAALAFHETGKEGLAYRHFGGMNAAFLDGHVRWYSREALPPDVILTGSAPSPPAP
jgi:prepilin-type processing-associated H-X9-DG protein